MPVLSLPLPRLSTGILEYLPIRVPFPFMRIASILPQAINEPIRISLMALFKLAWSAKVQLPVLITVCFMAFDIRLQLEINIFWENNVRQHANAANGANHRDATGQRRASREDMRRTALMAAALYQQQRRRLIQEIRAQQTRQREAVRRPSLPLQVKINAPLATAEDSDLEESFDRNDSSDTVTCSHTSIASENGSIESDDDVEGGTSNETKPKKGRSRPRSSSSRVVDDDEEEEDYEDENEDDFDDDTSSDDDDESDDLGGSSRGGFSSHGGGNGMDEYDQDDDDLGDNSNGDSGGGYSSPLVVEVEIRHHADSCHTVGEQSSTPKVPLFTFVHDTDNFNIFKKFFKSQSLACRETTLSAPCSNNMYVL